MQKEIHELAQLTSAQTYDLAMSIVAPRSIAWISTYNPDGSVNLAPYGMSGVVSLNPLILEFCSTGVKDTYTNAVKREAFVVNIPSVEHRPLVAATAEPLPAGESEAQAQGITTYPGKLVDAPIVATTKASFECEVLDTKHLGNSEIVYGQVKAIHTAEGLITETGHADFATLNPLTKLGANQWGITEAFS